jgi:hypothetical protein
MIADTWSLQIAFIDYADIAFYGLVGHKVGRKKAADGARAGVS